MKLNFKISYHNADALFKMLNYILQIYPKSEQVYLFLQKDIIVFYPDPKITSTDLYGRVTLQPTGEEETGSLGFMKEYNIRSEGDIDTILLSFVKFSDFLDVLRAFCVHKNDISFSLKREVRGGDKVELFRVRCKSSSGDSEVVDKVLVKVCPKEAELYPKDLEEKATILDFNEIETSIVFNNFYDRIITLAPSLGRTSSFEDSIGLDFSVCEDPESDKNILNIKLNVELYESEYKLKNSDNPEDSIHPSVVKIPDDYTLGTPLSVRISYPNFLRFFKIIQRKGKLNLEIDNENSLSMTYHLEDCRSASIFVMCNSIVDQS